MHLYLYISIFLHVGENVSRSWTISYCMLWQKKAHAEICIYLFQILLDDVKVSEQLLDLVFYSLVVLCTYRKVVFPSPRFSIFVFLCYLWWGLFNTISYFQVSNDMVLLHSTLVASSLYLLTVCISSQWLELAQVLLAYNKVNFSVYE